MNEQQGRPQSHYDQLCLYSSQVLIDGMPQKLKTALDSAVRMGADPNALIRNARKQCRGRTLTVLSIEAYLGADQDGVVRPKNKEKR